MSFYIDSLDYYYKDWANVLRAHELSESCTIENWTLCELTVYRSQFRAYYNQWIRQEIVFCIQTVVIQHIQHYNTFSEIQSNNLKDRLSLRQKRIHWHWFEWKYPQHLPGGSASYSALHKGVSTTTLKGRTTYQFLFVGFISSGIFTKFNCFSDGLCIGSCVGSCGTFSGALTYCLLWLIIWQIHCKH